MLQDIDYHKTALNGLILNRGSYNYHDSIEFERQISRFIRAYTGLLGFVGRAAVDEEKRNHCMATWVECEATRPSTRPTSDVVISPTTKHKFLGLTLDAISSTNAVY